MPHALVTSHVDQTAASHTMAEALKEAVHCAGHGRTHESPGHGYVFLVLTRGCGARVSNSGTFTRARRGRGLYEKTLELLVLVSITLAEMTMETAHGFRFGRNLLPRTGSADNKGPS